MWDGAFDCGVSLFAEPTNGLKGNYYEPYEVGFVEEIEMLAETYYFNFGGESQKKFLYYAKLKKKQRKEYRKERSENGNGNY